MPDVERLIQRAFVGGELAPAVYARADLTQYLHGLATCRNCFVRPHGGVSNRAGTIHVAPAKFADKKAEFIDFVFEAADQTYMLEVGDQYIRWFWHHAPVVVSGVSAWSGATPYVVGDLVVEGGVNFYCILDHTNQLPPNATYWYALTDDIYEIPTPYLEADLPELRFTQSADVITLTHPSYAPMELQRVGQTRWVLTTVITAPSLGPPTGLGVTPGATGTRTYEYIVTAVKEDTFEESIGSTSVVAATIAKPTIDDPNLLAWTAPVGDPVTEYNVYVNIFKNGIFGYIGSSSKLTFEDAGFAPDFTLTPPIQQTLFDATDDYPAVVTYYQQRRFFARSNNEPEAVWGSQIGAFSNFNVSQPLQDDDSIKFVIASLQLNPPEHLLPLTRLVLLSGEGEWVIRGDEDGAITPLRINPDQVGYVGSNRLRPVISGNSILHVQGRGTVLRDLRFERQIGGMAGRDLTVFSPHLFEGKTLTSLAYARQPHSIVWATRSDGTLLGLTYMREQDVLAWHRHDTGTDDEFERVGVVPDTSLGEDVTYVIVKRTVNGSVVRHIERFASRLVTTLSTDAVFMDDSLRYSGIPANQISGLDHLEGEIVAVLADGQVVFNGDPEAEEAEQFRVSNGAIANLPFPATEILAGLPIRFPEIGTLAIDVSGTDVRGRVKKVQSLTILADDSSRGWLGGPDADDLIAQRPEPWELTSPPVLDTGQQQLSITSGFTEDGTVLLRQPEPLPWTILGIIPNMEVGG